MNIPFPHPARLLASCALVSTLLAACGGGGDSAPAPVTGAASATLPAGAEGTDPAANSGPAGSPSPTATCGLSQFAESALASVNRIRAAGAVCGARGNFSPTAALRWNDRLTQSGTAHSLDMATANYFSHTSLDGRTLADRVNATGYAWSTIGENIAAGYTSMGSVMDGWAASDGHCANLMNPAYTEIGLACVSGAANSTYRTYWTMNLGRPL